MFLGQTTAFEGSVKKILLSLVILVALIELVAAAPFQTLGLLRTPDAYLLPSKAVEFVLVGYYRDIAAPSYVPEEYNGFTPYAMVGIGVLDRVQLGFFVGDDVHYINAKLKVLPETQRWPALTVGIDNIFSPVNKGRAQDFGPDSDWEYAVHPDKTDYEHFSPYIVGSKKVFLGGIGWMFNLGWGQYRYVGQVARSRIFNGLFTSIELEPWRNWAFQGEFDGKDFNVGLKHSRGNLALRLGAQAIEDWAKDSSYKDNIRLAFGLSYLFDRFAKTKRTPNDLPRAVPEPLLYSGIPPLNPDLSTILDHDGETVVVEISPEFSESAAADDSDDNDIITAVSNQPSSADNTSPEQLQPGVEIALLTPTLSSEPTVPTNDSGPAAAATDTTDSAPKELEVIISNPTPPPLPTPEINRESTGYKELSPELKQLLEELNDLRTLRQEGEQALEYFRQRIKELRDAE